eukprot:8027401-Pyramimonas_sp.AAC.1
MVMAATAAYICGRTFWRQRQPRGWPLQPLASSSVFHSLCTSRYRTTQAPMGVSEASGSRGSPYSGIFRPSLCAVGHGRVAP